MTWPLTEPLEGVGVGVRVDGTAVLVGVGVRVDVLGCGVKLGDTVTGAAGVGKGVTVNAARVFTGASEGGTVGTVGVLQPASVARTRTPKPKRQSLLVQIEAVRVNIAPLPFQPDL